MIRSLLLLAALAAPAHAETVAQSDIVIGKIRAGWQTQSGTHFAALHLELAPQWKTYWRAPGDAGIPPSFNWSGSTNLKAIRFHWPAPDVFETNGLQTVGYHDRLVLPFEVFAADPSQPVTLRAAVDVGVCKDICVPASFAFEAELTLPGQPDDLIRAALKARPKSAKEAGLQAISCDISPIQDGLRVTANLDLPRQGGKEIVVLEPGLPEIWVSDATVERSGNRLSATVDMVPPSGEPFALVRRDLVVTVIGGSGHAVEIRGCPSR